MAQKVENALDALLKDGFAKPRAKEYLTVLEEERDTPTGDAAMGFNHDAVDGYDTGLFDPDYLEWAHSYGFYAKQAYAYDLCEDNIDDYMSDYDYHRVWPLNGWQRIWINDKLTLKYMLAGSSFDKYLPEYYYYSTPSGPLPLLESSMKSGEAAFLDTLRSVGEFACKPCNGSRTVGFHKLSYVDGDYLVDNKPSSAEGVLEFLHKNPNYVFTEFLHPSEQMARVALPSYEGDGSKLLYDIDKAEGEYSIVVAATYTDTLTGEVSGYASTDELDYLALLKREDVAWGSEALFEQSGNYLSEDENV